MNRRLTTRHVDHIVALERDGKTSAETILADAKRGDSPLHDLYDWDVERAAETHWLERTREIVRLVRYAVHTETHSYTLPRYVRDPDVEPQTQGYATVESLRDDPDRARRALTSELERVSSVLTRARELAVGLHLDDEIEELLERVAGLRAVVDPQREDAA
ncbi:MAG: hypothetical protein WB562_05345 [Candidatus Sulfotelmatobacter sp.]